MLCIKNLRVNYDKKTILSGVTFDVSPAEVLGVIGPNGAGKTTLIRALSGTLPPTQGEIMLHDRDLRGISTLQRARLFAVVPQARNLPAAFTAWEMVLLGRTPHLNWLGQPSEKDEHIAREAMLATDTLQLSGRRLGELSGGEQQRLLLARALTQQTPVLLLDEPVTHLDLQYQVQFMRLVQAVCRSEKKMVIMVLHDLNMVSQYTDHVLLLVAGEQKLFAPTRKMFSEALLSQSFGLPLRIAETSDHQRVILPA